MTMDPGPIETATAPGFRTRGVAGMRDPKWIVVLTGYLAAVALMGMDPWYGARYFAYNQGIFAALLAVLIVAGFCWESALLGAPKGINLLLHVLLILPLTLLIGRIAGVDPDAASNAGLLGLLKALVTGAKDAIGFESVLPEWITDIFRNPGMLLMIVFVAVALTQRRPRRRFALTVIAFLIPALQTVSHDPRPPVVFAGGCLAMLIGMAFQFCRYGDVVSQKNILQRLGTVQDASELRCSLRIANRAVQEGVITEETALAIVQREYGSSGQQPPDATAGIARIVCHRLVREHRILEIFGDDRGVFLIPRPSLFDLDSLFDEIAVWMRKILLSVIVIIWLLSPIDLFPDSIPVLGAVDDALIALIGAGQWIESFRARKPHLPTIPNRTSPI